MEESIQQLEAHGIPVFLDIPQAIQAISRSIQASEQRNRMAAQTSLDTHRLAPALPANTLSEWDGKQLLHTQDAIMLPRAILVTDTEPDARPTPPGFPRSEEHTSELKSLMRISYAVF